MNVPDQRRGCRFGPCSEYVHLEAIGVDEVGFQFVQQPAERARVARGGNAGEGEASEQYGFR